jgi:hypothetical protein
MSDIISADTAKWKVRFVMYFLQKELTKIAKEQGINIPKGKSIIDLVHDDLRTCPNRGIRLMYKKIVEAGSNMKEHYQMSTIIDLAPFVLWVAYHDTAYRDPLFWTVNEIMNERSFKDDIQPFVKDPKDWYCPVWHDTKENTKTMQEKGELTKFQLSPDELFFVPERMLQTKEEMLKMQTEMERQLRIRDRNPKE